MIYIVLHCGSLQLCSVEARKEESNTGLGETEMQYKNNINTNAKKHKYKYKTPRWVELKYNRETKN